MKLTILLPLSNCLFFFSVKCFLNAQNIVADRRCCGFGAAERARQSGAMAPLLFRGGAAVRRLRASAARLLCLAPKRRQLHQHIDDVGRQGAGWRLTYQRTDGQASETRANSAAARSEDYREPVQLGLPFSEFNG
ncbi:MAG TPA: hypothetical protein VJ770_19175 [Stellaceae bacterium]|nr:hypothetical protein [Stellaceae bacterium]